MKEVEFNDISEGESSTSISGSYILYQIENFSGSSKSPSEVVNIAASKMMI